MRNEKYNKKLLSRIFILLTLLWTGIIFSFSLQPAELSADTSMGLAKKLVELFLPWLTDELEMLSHEQLELVNHIIRKCAHFTEYMILGIFAAAALTYTKYKNENLLGISYCVLSASVDETIQLFVEGRAGRITDVMIDSAGAVTGVMVLFLIMKVRKKFGKCGGENHGGSCGKKSKTYMCLL